MTFDPTSKIADKIIQLRTYLDQYTSELIPMGPQLNQLQTLASGYENMIIGFESNYRCGNYNYKWALETTRKDRSNNLEQQIQLKQRMNRLVQLCADIEARIKILESQETGKNCIICTEQVHMLIPCGVCKFSLCPRCYVSIIKNNQGISKCPHCRNEIGQVISDQELHKYISYANSIFL